MAVDIKDASHEDIFHMACIGEVSLDQFKEWLDAILNEERLSAHDEGYQDGYNDGTDGN